MTELLIRKGTELDPLPQVCGGESGQTLYRLTLEEDGLWHRQYQVTGPDREPVGTLEYRHEAFRLAKMPRIRGYLGREEVFLVKREIEALQDKVELESRDLTVEGEILKGKFRFCRKGRCLAAFRFEKERRSISVEEDQALAALFALALELL